MPRYFRRFAEGDFDVEDLKFRAYELAAFVEAAKREYRLAGSLVAVGYSNGANIAAGLMLFEPRVLAGGVLFRPMTPFVPDQPPDLHGTQVLLAAGNRDPIVPPSLTEQLAQILNGAGAAVSLHWHQGGHELGQDDVGAAQRWLAGLKS
jgi:phospholipase/carboxylesterase